MNTNFMKLRDIMRTQNVTYYLVPSEDPHQSENRPGVPVSDSSSDR